MKSVRPGLLLAVILAGMLALEFSMGLCVQDDTYISLRYARNLVEGHGLVFNVGEVPVEGYTNFLWTVWLAAVLAVGGNGVFASVCGGVLSAVGLVVFTWWWGRGARWTKGRPWLALAAPALVAFDPGLLLESVQGLETVFFSLLVTALFWTGMEELENPDRLPWSGLIGGLAALTRPEGLLFYGLLQGLRLVRGRSLPSRATWVGWGVFGVLVLGHLFFRWRFYGDLLPNTFYAKTGGGPEMWLRGLQYLGSFTQHHLGLVLLGIWGVWKGLERGNARDQVTLLVIPVYLLYVVSVGGDFKHSGRFLLPVLPLFALWAQEGLGRLLDAMGAGSRARLALGAGSVLFCAWNQVQYWPIPYSSAVYRVQNQVERVEVGQFLRTAFPPDTWIAIHSAGTVPYISGLPTIDCWGLSDLHIARIDVEGLGSGIAGHEKTDYAYVFSRTPTVYLPEKDLVTPRPHRLVVPKDFPASFEEQYVQRSARLPSGKAVNLWLHRTARGLSPSSPGEDGPGGD